MRILIIEDNSIIANAIKRSLEGSYIIDLAFAGESGLNRALSVQYDTILLDLALPDIAGEEVCKTLRKNKITTPIIIISGKGEVNSKVNLLGLGADDYVTKPFNLSELKARIDVAMRHIDNSSPTGKLIGNGITLDPVNRLVYRNGREIVLRRKEFDLLEYLMRNQGQTLTREMILNHIWDHNDNLWANVIDVHIKHLRDKIDRPFGHRSILTVHGMGYKFGQSKSFIHEESSHAKQTVK